jgi:hypothetical protein
MAKVVKANPLCGAIFVSVPAARRGAADYGVAYVAFPSPAIA